MLNIYKKLYSIIENNFLNLKDYLKQKNDSLFLLLF